MPPRFDRMDSQHTIAQRAYRYRRLALICAFLAGGTAVVVGPKLIPPAERVHADIGKNTSITPAPLPTPISQPQQPTKKPSPTVACNEFSGFTIPAPNRFFVATPKSLTKRTRDVLYQPGDVVNLEADLIETQESIAELTQYEWMIKDAEIAFKASQVEVRLAKERLNNTKYLMETAQQSPVSTVDRRTAESNHRQAKINVEQAEVEEERAKNRLNWVKDQAELGVYQFKSDNLKSASNGIVVRTHSDERDPERRGNIRIEVLDPRVMWVKVKVSREQLSQFQLNQEVDVVYNGQSWPGKVCRLLPFASNNGSFLFYVEVNNVIHTTTGSMATDPMTSDDNEVRAELKRYLNPQAQFLPCWNEVTIRLHATDK